MPLLPKTDQTFPQKSYLYVYFPEMTGQNSFLGANLQFWFRFSFSPILSGIFLLSQGREKGGKKYDGGKKAALGVAKRGGEIAFVFSRF